MSFFSLSTLLQTEFFSVSTPLNKHLSNISYKLPYSLYKMIHYWFVCRIPQYLFDFLLFIGSFLYFLYSGELSLAIMLFFLYQTKYMNMKNGGFALCQSKLDRNMLFDVSGTQHDYVHDLYLLIFVCLIKYYVCRLATRFMSHDTCVWLS